MFLVLPKVMPVTIAIQVSSIHDLTNNIHNSISYNSNFSIYVSLLNKQCLLVFSISIVIQVSMIHDLTDLDLQFYIIAIVVQVSIIHDSIL